MLIQMTDRHDVRNWTKELRRTGGFEPNNYEDTGDYKGYIVLQFHAFAPTGVWCDCTTPGRWSLTHKIHRQQQWMSL